MKVTARVEKMGRGHALHVEVLGALHEAETAGTPDYKTLVANELAKGLEAKISKAIAAALKKVKP